MMAAEVPQLLTIQEAADQIRVSRDWVYRQRRAGRLETVLLGGRAYVTVEEWARFLRANMHPSIPGANLHGAARS